MTTFHVVTYDGGEYDVEADSIEIDAENSNRVTFFNEDEQAVAQENNTSSVYPA